MTKEQCTIGLEAAILCCGYSIGYYADADIEHWAERQIDVLDEPPLALIELATLRDTYPIDAMNLLRSLGGVLSPAATIESEIGFIGLLYDAKRISLATAIRRLFPLGHDEGVTDKQRSMLYWLDDAYDLALAGTYGTLSQVASEFRSFVQPYADNLRAQDVIMLREIGA